MDGVFRKECSQSMQLPCQIHVFCSSLFCKFVSGNKFGEGYFSKYFNMFDDQVVKSVQLERGCLAFRSWPSHTSDLKIDILVATLPLGNGLQGLVSVYLVLVK